MSYRARLVEALKRKYSPAEDCLVVRIGLPRILGFAIIDLWTKQVPEDADTALIRQAQIRLDSGGDLSGD